MSVPKLRFKEFEGEWTIKKIGNIFTKHSNPVAVDKNVQYQEIGIRSHGKGIFHKEPVIGKKIGNKRVFWVEPSMFIVNIVFAWEKAIDVTSDKEEGLIASHRFPMYKAVEDKSNVYFMRHFFLTKKGTHLLGLASPGGAGRNKTLGQTTFANLKVKIPSVSEQTRISEFLAMADKKIDQLTSKKELLTKYKKGLLQQIFSQKIRFTKDDGSDFEDWDYKQLNELLEYIQPTKFIVDSTEYQNSYTTPVLTAGKSFILGFTNEVHGLYPAKDENVIIFDDFTTSIQFVDFDFKVKSSAMKILKPKIKDENIYFIFCSFSTIEFHTGDDHKRRWISEYSLKEIPYPCIEEQTKIANCLSKIDESIEITANQLEQAKTWKKGLLQQMFV